MHDIIREIRSLAQAGSHYTKDPYDRQRYQRLLSISDILYSEFSSCDLSTVERFFMPEKGRLIVYASDLSRVLSPFTAAGQPRQRRVGLVRGILGVMERRWEKALDRPQEMARPRQHRSHERGYACARRLR